jgi:acetyl-CoA C-acetyltransferase
MNRPVIVSFARTPIGRFRGSLSSVRGPDLAASAVKGAINRAGLEDKISIKEAFMGNVISAGIGQAPARQAGKCMSQTKMFVMFLSRFPPSFC